MVYGSPTRHDGPCNRVRTSTTPPRPSVLRECVGCVGSAAEGCVAVGVTGYRPADAATINHTLNGCVRARGIVCVSAGGVEARSSGAVLVGAWGGCGPSARGDALLLSRVEGYHYLASRKVRAGARHYASYRSQICRVVGNAIRKNPHLPLPDMPYSLAHQTIIHGQPIRPTPSTPADNICCAIPSKNYFVRLAMFCHTPFTDCAVKTQSIARPQPSPQSPVPGMRWLV